MATNDTNVSSQTTTSNHQLRPAHDSSGLPVYRRPRRRRDEEDDRGSVQDCFTCGFAYFSRWEVHKPFSLLKMKPTPEDLECDRCITDRTFVRNMAILTKGK